MMNKKSGGLSLLFILFTLYVSKAEDSILVNKHSLRFQKITGDTSKGIIRGSFYGTDYTTILQQEKALLEGQGDDFLLYRVLCDSILSAEISYTFNLNKQLIAVQIDFSELLHKDEAHALSTEFVRYFTDCYGTSIMNGQSFLSWKDNRGNAIELNVGKGENRTVAQIEFYIQE